MSIAHKASQRDPFIALSFVLTRKRECSRRLYANCLKQINISVQIVISIHVCKVRLPRDRFDSW